MHLEWTRPFQFLLVGYVTLDTSGERYQVTQPFCVQNQNRRLPILRDTRGWISNYQKFLDFETRVLLSVSTLELSGDIITRSMRD